MAVSGWGAQAVALRDSGAVNGAGAWMLADGTAVSRAKLGLIWLEPPRFAKNMLVVAGWICDWHLRGFGDIH